MSNANKARGTAWESAIRELARSRGHSAYRTIAQGAGDEGDLNIDDLLCVQAKDVAKHDLSGWLSDVQEQAGRARLPFGVVFVKRRRRPTGKGYAVMEIDDLLALAYRVAAAESALASDPAGYRDYVDMIDNYSRS